MENLNPIALEQCLRTAKKYGVPRDQAQGLLQVGYIPLPWQWRFHAAAREADIDGGPVNIGLGGARGPGKSHAVLSQVALDDCQRFPGLKVLFLRQTGISAKESFDDLVDKVVVGHVKYKKTHALLRVGKRGKIILGGFKDERDIDKYIGIEYDIIIVEELNQITEDKLIKLEGSLRTSKKGWRPRLYASFNPGGIGHSFVRERFVVPSREKTETKTRFIKSTYKDNPYLNKEYIEYLESLKGDLGRAWRDGEWEIFAGQVFREFKHTTHVIQTVIPKKQFTHLLNMDWGYSKKSAFAAYANAVIPMKTEDGDVFNRVITYREWYGNLKHPDEWAEIIYNQAPFRFNIAVCDPSMHNPKTDGSTPIKDLFEQKWKDLYGGYWASLERGSNNRIQGVATIHNWLSLAPDGQPYWMITDNCVNLIRTLPMLVYNDTKGNKEDVDSSQDDHAFDSMKYGLSHVKFISASAGPIHRGGKPKSSYPIMTKVEDDKQHGMDIDIFTEPPRRKGGRHVV